MSAVYSLAEGLTSPAPDVAANDRDVERLFEHSVFAAGWHRADRAVAAAWRESRLRQATRWTRRLEAIEAIQGVGVALATAACVALIVNALKPVPNGPFVWVVPVVALAFGVGMLAAPVVLVRAWHGRMFR